MGLLTPLERPYNVQVLIEVYLRTIQRDFRLEETKAYYDKLLATLEDLFGVHLSIDEPSLNPAHWDRFGIQALFQSTAFSFSQITSPMDGYLEATGLILSLRQAGELGKSVLQLSTEIWKGCETSRELHRKMRS